jgi:hypothetical protein
MDKRFLIKTEDSAVETLKILCKEMPLTAIMSEDDDVHSMFMLTGTTIIGTCNRNILKLTLHPEVHTKILTCFFFCWYSSPAC